MAGAGQMTRYSVYIPLRKLIKTFEKPVYNEIKRHDIYSKTFC